MTNTDLHLSERQLATIERKLGAPIADVVDVEGTVGFATDGVMDVLDLVVTGWICLDEPVAFVGFAELPVDLTGLLETHAIEAIVEQDEANARGW